MGGTARVLAGRYRLGEPIGIGGMGCVYAALDLEYGREVALKGLTNTACTPANRRRLHREAEAVSLIRHRSVCEVYDLDHHRGSPFIVMERLRGETLRDRLRDIGALSSDDAIAIAFQVLDGLGAAHGMGFLHRDVKPGNIFITSPRGATPKVKLIDFGLARRLPALARVDDLITDPDMIPGTPSYMAPEQLAASPDLDGRVDIWAAGLVLYEMLIGRRAFERGSPIDMVRKICGENPPPPSSLRCDLPQKIDAVIACAIEKDRRARFPSTGHMHAALLDACVRHYASEIRQLAPTRKFRPEALTLADGDESSDISVSA
jgi:serine/threonine-protein kinase